MKLKDQNIIPPKAELIVIPRASGDIILYAAPVMDFSEFKTAVPEPKPPIITKRGESPEIDLTDEDYKKAMKNYGELKFNWTNFKSLTMGTPELTFDQVLLDNSNTWNLFEKEMLETFTQGEVNYIVNKVMEANGLSQKRLQEARDRFLNPAPVAVVKA